MASTLEYNDFVRAPTGISKHIMASKRKSWNILRQNVSFV